MDFCRKQCDHGTGIFSSVNQGGTAAESNEFRSSLMELKMSSVKDDFFVFLRS